MKIWKISKTKNWDKTINWANIDWSITDEEISKTKGIPLHIVIIRRDMHAPHSTQFARPGRFNMNRDPAPLGYQPRGEGQWNTQLDKLFGLAQVNEDLEKPVLFWESYDGVRKGRTLVEIYKNPDNLTIRRIRRSQGYGYEIAVLVTKNNTYAFRRDLELHSNVARKLGLSEYVGVLLGDGYAMITDATVESLRHTKEAARMVREAFPDIIEISYFDEAIVGDWEEIEE